MTAEELYDLVLNKAKDFGMKPKNPERIQTDAKGNAIVRKNIIPVSFQEGSAYFGIISKDEDISGRYSDFSFVVFPDDEKVVKACVVGLAVGSNGFKNDYQIASLPGLRRLFLKLNENNTFFKDSFDDIETTSTELLKEVKTNYQALSSVLDSYKTLIPAAKIIDFHEGLDKSLSVIYAWLATYAKFRDWGTKNQKKLINEIISEKQHNQSYSEIEAKEQREIKHLLKNRHYIVLQGAPGTGKTYTALAIAKNLKKENVFFEQFHAETTFSDFVYGIEPNLNEKEGIVKFKEKEGILYKAIKQALKHNDEDVLLIIDEINRANLSNVLGPVFYLFEYQATNRTATIQIGNIKLNELPSNLYVIATMNTADRSLAVVDFALRRRFAWYTMRPHIIAADEGRTFMSDYFHEFADIFFKYATDEELNLQPGQSYFIVKQGSKEEQNNEMKVRLVYELMPLIKEYLEEGFLLKAKNSFTDLFLRETGRLLYE